MRTLLNIICSKKVKYSILILFLLFLYTTICAFSYVNAVSADLCDSVFRLHVIANSDEKADQDLKYIVRDNVLEYMNEIAKDANSKEEAIKIANEHKDDFKNIALNTIREQGFNYDVSIEIGNFAFPTKTYGDISLPSGYYDALRIQIGKANGQNWWCVMFPPLCFVDVSSGIVPDDSKEAMKSELSEDEFSVIETNENSEVSFKFKLIELFQNVKIMTAKN